MAILAEPTVNNRVSHCNVFTVGHRQVVFHYLIHPDIYLLRQLSVKAGRGVDCQLNTLFRGHAFDVLQNEGDYMLTYLLKLSWLYDQLFVKLDLYGW